MDNIRKGLQLVYRMSEPHFYFCHFEEVKSLIEG